MNFFLWSCQGMNGFVFRRVLKNFIQVHKPSLVILMERIISSVPYPRAIKKLGFSWSQIIEASGLGGGIWILKEDIISVFILKNHR
jgi:hypothetical protein